MSDPIVLTTAEALQASVPKGRCLQGSGILCWTVCPLTQEVYFLLGKEADTGGVRRHHRNKMKGWCDFGGCSKKPGDSDSPLGETASHTAAREFIEETCSMVQLEVCGTNTNYKTVQQALQHGRFDFVITTKATKGRRRYVCFVCRVDWDPDIPTKFQNVRSVLSHMYQDASYVHLLHKQVPHSSPYFRPGMNVTLQGESALIRAVLDVAWDTSANLLKLQLETQKDKQEPQTGWHSFQVSADDKFVTRYVAWVKSRQQLLRNYQGLPLEVRHHPSVRALYKYGNIYSLSVNPDYLEKSELAWWSLSSLQKEIDDSGRFNPFRPCFRSVIKLAVAHVLESCNSLSINKDTPCPYLLPQKILESFTASRS